MSNHHIWLHSHASWFDTDTSNYDLEQFQQETCSRDDHMGYSRNYQMFGIAGILVVWYESNGWDHDNTHYKED